MVGLRLVYVHQSGVAGYICEQDGGELALHCRPPSRGDVVLQRNLRKRIGPKMSVVWLFFGASGARPVLTRPTNIASETSSTACRQATVHFQHPRSSVFGSAPIHGGSRPEQLQKARPIR